MFMLPSCSSACRNNEIMRCIFTYLLISDHKEYLNQGNQPLALQVVHICGTRLAFIISGFVTFVSCIQRYLRTCSVLGLSFAGTETTMTFSAQKTCNKLGLSVRRCLHLNIYIARSLPVPSKTSSFAIPLCNLLSESVGPRIYPRFPPSVLRV